MTFVYNRRFWDTANLIEFKTGDRVHSSIFVTPEFSMAFVVTSNPRVGMSLRRVSPEEVAVLAARYNVDALQRVFPLPTDVRKHSCWQAWLGRLKFAMPMQRREWASVGD